MLFAALRLWRTLVRSWRRAGHGHAETPAPARPQTLQRSEALADAVPLDARYVTPGVSTSRVETIYADLETELIECIWSESFHSAPRKKGEPFESSLQRLQRDLARTLELGPGKRALDVGCGVGGPMRNIARLTGATIDGVTVNGYQAERAAQLIAEDGLGALCRVIEADCRRLPYADATFDAAYALSSLQEVRDREAALRELARVLKPGALLTGVSWCLTSRFQADNPAHARLRDQLERGGLVAPIPSSDELPRLLHLAGFQLLEERDLGELGPDDEPWYGILVPRWNNLRSVHVVPWCQAVIATSVRAMEAVGLTPRGTSNTVKLLQDMSRGVVVGGQSGLLTGVYYFLARKP